MKKHIFALITIFALIAWMAPAADTLDTAIRKLEPNQNRPIPTAFSPTSIFSYGLLDKNNKIQLSAWEGALKIQGTFNRYQTILNFPDPLTGNVSITFPSSTTSTALLQTTLTTNSVDAANSIWGESSSLAFEGATANGFETRITPVDPTADRTVTIPDGTGTVSLLSTAVVTPATTISFTPSSSASCSTLVPAQAETINGVTTGAVSGKAYYLVITTSGSSSFTLTFGTNFKTTGTLATGTASGKVFVMLFIFDGTSFNEVSRTTAM